MSHKPSTRPARHHVGCKEIFMQEREEEAIDRQIERENFIPYPMKMHSNRWAEGVENALCEMAARVVALKKWFFNTINNIQNVTYKSRSDH